MRARQRPRTVDSSFETQTRHYGAATHRRRVLQRWVIVNHAIMHHVCEHVLSTCVLRRARSQDAPHAISVRGADFNSHWCAVRCEGDKIARARGTQRPEHMPTTTHEIDRHDHFVQRTHCPCRQIAIRYARPLPRRHRSAITPAVFLVCGSGKGVTAHDADTTRGRIMGHHDLLNRRGRREPGWNPALPIIPFTSGGTQ